MSSAHDQTRSVLEFVIALAGPVIWFAHFGAVYSIQGFGCQHASIDNGLVYWAMLALSVSALSALAVILATAYRSAERDRANANTADHWSFMHYLQLAIAGLAVLAVSWTTLAVFLLPPCTPVFGMSH